MGRLTTPLHLFQRKVCYHRSTQPAHFDFKGIIMQQQSKSPVGQNPPAETPKAKQSWCKPTLIFVPLQVATQQVTGIDGQGVNKL
jgi:hypothetical protein